MASIKTLMIKAKAYNEIIQICKEKIQDIDTEINSKLINKIQKEKSK